MDNEKYLIMCNRHNSCFGKNIALWWGYKELEGGYSTDLRHAHLYNYDYLVKGDFLEVNNSDIAIKLSDLGFTEEEFNNLPKAECLRILIEKGTLNELLGLKIK